ncbi:MAG: KEOPS complex subunit Pcc1 [Candidatus Altiarchaeota archaeon]
MKMANAILTTTSKDPECIVKALTPDNGDADITLKVDGKKITTTVSAGNPRTLLATLDDIIRCQIIAEEVIRNG